MGDEPLEEVPQQVMFLKTWHCPYAKLKKLYCINIFVWYKYLHIRDKIKFVSVGLIMKLFERLFLARDEAKIRLE